MIRNAALEGHQRGHHKETYRRPLTGAFYVILPAIQIAVVFCCCCLIQNNISSRNLWSARVRVGTGHHVPRQEVGFSKSAQRALSDRNEFGIYDVTVTPNIISPSQTIMGCGFVASQLGVLQQAMMVLGLLVKYSIGRVFLMELGRYFEQCYPTCKVSTWFQVI